MIHDSTWLGRTRATRRMRWTAPLGLVLACVLLAGLPVAAQAAAPEMRGEWELTLTSTNLKTNGTALIAVEADGSGKFTSSSALFLNVFPATFSGTLEGSTASATILAPPYSTAPEVEFFSSKAMTVTSGVGTLSMSGPGTITYNKASPEPGTLVAKRIKTYKQIEEKEAKEKQEREARENIRGEWALTMQSGPQTTHGVAVIAEAANAKNEFASAGFLVEGLVPGSFSGTLKGEEATVMVTTEAYGSIPSSTFTGTTMKVESPGNPTTISGSGTLTIGSQTLPETLTATRMKTYGEVVEGEITREAKEKQEKEEQAAREQKEKEQKEKEQTERQEREAREAAEKLAVAKTATVTTPGNQTLPPPLVSALLATRTGAVSSGGTVSLDLTNSNDMPVSGRMKLTLSKTGKAAAAKHSKSSTLGEASYSIPAHGEQVIKVKLSHNGRTELTRRKTLHVVVTLTTQASGQTSTSKTFELTLHAAKPAHGKH